MGTIVMAGTLVLVVMGFGNHLWWLAAVAVLFLYVQFGRGASASSSATSSATSSSAPPGGPAGGASPGASASSYRAYRDRRDRQARWERRYRRERPLETRRQEREKSK